MGSGWGLKKIKLSVRNFKEILIDFNQMCQILLEYVSNSAVSIGMLICPRGGDRAGKIFFVIFL